jgi:hypothetical protein
MIFAPLRCQPCELQKSWQQARSPATPREILILSFGRAVTASARQKLTNLTKESRHTISKGHYSHANGEKRPPHEALPSWLEAFVSSRLGLGSCLRRFSVGIVGIVAAPAGREGGVQTKISCLLSCRRHASRPELLFAGVLNNGPAL